MDKLRDYVLNYDVHIGKRKADSIANRPRKRQKDRTSKELQESIYQFGPIGEFFILNSSITEVPQAGLPNKGAIWRTGI